MPRKQKSTGTISPPPCVVLWERARELCGQGIETLWERTNILCQLVEDEDFLRRFVQIDEVIGDLFQREALHDTTVTFLELQTVWEHFPDLSDWRDKGLNGLLDEAAEINASEATEPRHRVSWKAKAAELQKEIDEIRNELRRVQNENRELRKLVAQGEPVAA